MANALAQEKSPYLLQHAENPVDWRAWSPSAFEEAQKQDKPVFLSIGYSTCHWCHVMARESFEDPEVAQLLNRNYLSVKVDREERPDVDAVYMAACMAATGSGGWPLTALLTPEQKPFWVGTYLPKKQLLRLLDEASRLWDSGREALLEAGDALTAHLQEPEAYATGEPSFSLLQKAAGQFSSRYDNRWGGFGPAPKFPAAHNLLFLLHYAQAAERPDCRKMAEQTLGAMYRGGLFDHVGGGFARYSTDAQWLVPHFEKMLYDNALLAMAYAEVQQTGRTSLYGKIARRTLDYVLRELSGPEGGFCCGQDADSGGGEGGYYLLTPEDAERAVGPEAAKAFCGWYGVTEAGNFEGKSIPNLIGQAGWEREPEGMAALREKVRAYRLDRIQLHRDDKVLTSWTGLMIAALARAGRLLEEPRYLTAAREAQEFLSARLTEPSGHLLARWRDGDAAHPGKLDDYAFSAWALLELYASTLDAAYLKRAVRVSELLLQLFFDRERGGFYPYAADGEQLISRNKETYDGAIPSGNSAAGLVLVRLARLTGEARWQEAAELQLRYLAGAAEDYPAGHSFALMAMLEALSPGAELLCAAAGENPPEELTAFLRHPFPGLTVLLKTPGNADILAKAAPFTAEYPLPERGIRYYLCQNRTCSQPADSIREIEVRLEALSSRKEKR